MSQIFPHISSLKKSPKPKPLPLPLPRTIRKLKIVGAGDLRLHARAWKSSFKVIGKLRIFNLLVYLVSWQTSWLKVAESLQEDYWINPKNHLRMYVALWCYKCKDGMDLRVGWGIESILYYTIDHLSVLMRMTKYQIVYLSISISVTIYYAAILFWCFWRWQWGNCCLCQSQTNLKWFPHNIFIFTNQERKSRYIKERILLGRPQPEKYCTMCMSSPIRLRRHPGKVGACSSKSDWLNHSCICATHPTSLEWTL